MKSFYKPLATTALMLMGLQSVPILKAQSTAKNDPDLTRTILYHDSLFWSAYNVCDVSKMAHYFTEDFEFYHDKQGLTVSKEKFENSVRDGLCHDPNWRLRREVLKGTVKVFPMNNYGALITGEHIFYINEQGKDEYLDGYGKFTHLWLFKDNTWKMSRVISYDHGPAPYINKRKEVKVSAAALQRIVGKYSSANSGSAAITVSENTIKIVMGDFTITMSPESETKFFAKDRDLQFDFIMDKSTVTKVVVYEKGKVVDELKRI